MLSSGVRSASGSWKAIGSNLLCGAHEWGRLRLKLVPSSGPCTGADTTQRHASRRTANGDQVSNTRGTTVAHRTGLCVGEE